MSQHFRCDKDGNEITRNRKTGTLDIGSMQLQLTRIHYDTGEARPQVIRKYDVDLCAEHATQLIELVDNWLAEKDSSEACPEESD